MKHEAHTVVMPRTIAARHYVDLPGRGLRNLYVFESPKNDKRLAVFGQVCFWHLMLAEGDPQIRRYILCSDFASAASVSEAVDVHFMDETIERWYFCRRGLPEEDQCPYPVVIKTEAQIRAAGLLPQNWRFLCAARTRAHGKYAGKELLVLRGLFEGRHTVALSEVIAQPGIDFAIMLAAIAQQLAVGTLRTELTKQLFSRRSLLSRIEK
ncbi:hypothetical protein [Cupriavidus taiwanensis]|uniref:hypothetical protein n=1 Tax=Cupriavidus taiwanensis TaxID=164546 RepID=UPI000E16C28E|nr:hypothetical protein [Cupriavidus taiwanensis]SPA53923.1 conserved hypothetical protein [Cupriavidus taiwanensis]